MHTDTEFQAKPAAAPAPVARRVIDAAPAAQVRVPLEAEALERLWQDPVYRGLAGRLQGEIDPAAVRRELMAEALRLSPSMAPDLYRVAHEALSLLSIEAPVELYQAAGAENARMHLVSSPVLLEVQGRLLSLLDDDALRALLGHELGHYLAHGDTDGAGGARVAARVLLHTEHLPDTLLLTARTHSLACELTADRYGLLVCQDLHAALRLTMICTTGLSGDTLTWDTQAYLDQARELVEAMLAEGETSRGVTHPEHSLRTYALWLFSESDLYHALTGRGPGSRPLAEVNATLARLVSLTPPAEDASLALFEIPLVEVHECALSGAVMVAWADGRLDEAESDVLAEVFGPLVPDWRRLLDLDAAEARFAETVSVMRTATAQQQEALFHMLSHVMAADGVVTQAEVSTLLGIGQALGQLDRFTVMLTSTLKALGIDLVAGEVPPAPLRVAAREGQAALDAFLSGVQRRGSAQVTVRRLLRLLGASQPSPALFERLAAAFEAHQVTASTPVADAPLEALITLTAPPIEAPAAPARPALEGLRAELVRALGRLRDKLVSGDGRSPSVRLRQARTGRVFDLFRLESVKVGQAIRVLTSVQAGQAVGLVTAHEAGHHAEGRRAVEGLLALDRAARDRADETGADDLYLGHPLLSGTVGQGAQAYLLRAPLILYPVALVRDARGARGYQLQPRTDEDPVVNHALLRALFHKLGFALTDSLVDTIDGLAADPAEGAPAVLARLAEVGLDIVVAPPQLAAFEPVGPADDAQVGPLTVHECALLGIFPQSSSDLLQDYDALLKGLSDPATDLPAALAAASALLPAALQAELDAPAPTDDAAAPWTPRPPVVLADPSQRAVIPEARQQRALVVDGPPGTGKSQVIVNLVADALARGERVAVVCEKRAALDVVSQRLEGLGLRDALAVVHDLNDDRKPLYAQIARRFDGHAPTPYDAEEAAEFHASAARYTQALADRAAGLARRAPGSALTYGQLLLLRAGEGLPDAVAAPLAAVGDAGRARLETWALRLQQFEPLWRRGGPWRGPEGERWRPFADAAAVDAAVETLRGAAAAAEVAEAAFDQAPVDRATLRAHGDAIHKALMVLRPWAAGGAAAQVSDLWACLRRAAQPDGLAPLAEAQAAFDAHGTAMVQVGQREALTEPAAYAPAAEALRHWQGRFWRIFVPAWWRARAAIKAVVQALLPDLSGQGVGPALLQAIDTRLTASAGWRAVSTAYAQLGFEALPDAPAPAGERLAAVQRAAEAATALRALAPALGALEAWPAAADGAAAGADPAGVGDWLATLTARAELAATDAAFTEATRAARAVLPWLPADPRASTLAGLAHDLSESGDQLLAIDELLAAAAQAPDAVDGVDGVEAAGPAGAAPLPPLLPVLDALHRAAPTAAPAQWTALLTHAWASAHAAALEAADPALAALGTAPDDRRAQDAATELGRLQRELGEVEVEFIQHQLDDRPLLAEPEREKYARKTPQQAVRETLLKEVRKTRRLMTLRRFVRTFAADGLLDLLPVWLLSPETMAVLFPRAPLFDLVIFDEASQCTVESGFPVLLRAKRAVIAGDEHQMPPTAFFQTGDDESDDLSAAELAARDVFAAESLLTLARGRGPHRRLSWHYRCQHEALIAFSNHAIYEGDLRTIPSTATPQAPSALKWVTVADGAYDAGANPPEAERVVALLDELLGADPEHSLGVVTFNLKQRRAVLDAIDARRLADDAFEARWAAAEARPVDARPFVKNLESVQGDERDVIVFSLGHAPQARVRGGTPTGEYYVPARFGPLGQRGGERRLNVAISRAKQACYVVSSFSPEQLSVASATHRGPLLFKQFIEFAHRVAHGRHAEAARILDGVRGGPSAQARVQRRPAALPATATLAAQIALALEADGVPLERDVGVSGFTVPVAVFDPADPTGFKLAILTDDGAHDLEPFEVHVHRPAVLAMRGWQVLRVTAATWYRRRDEVLASVHAAVPEARGALTRSPWVELGRGAPAPTADAPAAGPSEGAPAAWHAAVSARLRPLLAVLDREGQLSATDAARLVNPRAFRRLVLALDALRSEGRLPWDFEVTGEADGEVLHRR